MLSFLFSVKQRATGGELNPKAVSLLYCYCLLYSAYGPDGVALFHKLLLVMAFQKLAMANSVMFICSIEFG
jgi:hypothetical protein